MNELTVKEARAGAREVSRITRKIGIFGTTPSRMSGPIKDPEWEIWTIGPGGKDAHRWDRLFETHNEWPLDFGELQDGKSYLDDLSQVKPPQQVHTLAPMKDSVREWAENHGKDAKWLKDNIRGNFKANVVINRERWFKKYRRMLFQSSIDYAICMAIEEGASDIGCWGIDLESGEEYISQHWSCSIWLMLARLAGINVHLPKASGLERDLTPYPDRYETHIALTVEKKINWLNDIIAQKEAEWERLRSDVSRTEGAILMLRKLERPAEEIQKGEAELIMLNQHTGQLAATVNQLKGERSGMMYIRRMYCWGMLEPT